jgi:hypothetical protein
MNTHDQYKDDAVRLIYSNPLDVLDLIVADINRTFYHVKDFEAKVNIESGGAAKWTCKAVVLILAASRPVELEKVWAGIVEFFATRGLVVVMAGQSTKQRFETLEHVRVYTGSDLTFKVVFEPDRDLTVSCLYD